MGAKLRVAGGVIASVIALAIVAAVAWGAGAAFSDRAVKVSVAGAAFELSPPDVAKCQTQAKLLADSMVAVTETIKALTSQTSGEAAAVAALRTQYLKDNIYEPSFVVSFRPGTPRHSDFLTKATEEFGTDLAARDAVLKQQAALLAKIHSDGSGCDTRPREPTPPATPP